MFDNPYMDIPETIATNLAAWMREHPRLNTLKKVSTASGVGFGTVQRIRKAEGNVTIQNLDAIARAFRRSLGEFLCLQQGSSWQESAGIAPEGEENELLLGFRIASDADREMMLYIARRALQNLNSTKDGEI